MTTLAGPKRCPFLPDEPQQWVAKSGVTCWEGAVVGSYPTGANAGYIDNIEADPSLQVRGVARHTVIGGTSNQDTHVDEKIIPMVFPATLTTASRGAIVYGTDSATASLLATAGPPIGMLMEVVSTTRGMVGVGPTFLARAAAAASATASASRIVRNVVFNNVADLTAYTVAASTSLNDNVLNIATDRVLLVGQTTVAQNGEYVVGAVTTGVAPLTRAPDMPAGVTFPNGLKVTVSEGGFYGGKVFRSTSTQTGGWTVGTHDPKFYPEEFSQTVTLASGTYTIGFGSTATPDEPLMLLSTAKVSVTRNTHAGTLGTDGYEAPQASRVAGVVGTAVLVINSTNDNGGTGSSDTSTVDVIVRQ